MENWFMVHEMVKQRQLEMEKEYTTYYEVSDLMLKKQKKRKIMIHKIVNTIGRFLETWGKVLQKKYQTC